MKGRLDDEPLPSILQRLFLAQATGCLALNARSGGHELWLREGFPVAVTLPGSAEQLGKVLLEMGVLDEATYKRIENVTLRPGLRFGDFLLEQKLLSDEQLRLALKAQVRRKLHKLFFLEGATFEYAPRPHDNGLLAGESLRVHPWRAIYHGVRTAWSDDRLTGALFLLEGRALHCKIDGDALARYGLGADDGRIGELMRRGFWLMPDLVDASGLPPQPIHALVYALYLTEGLDLKSPSEVQLLKRKAGEAPLLVPNLRKVPERQLSSGAFTMPSSAGPMPQAPTHSTASAVFSSPVVSQPASAKSSTSSSQTLTTMNDADSARKHFTTKATRVEGENLFEVLGLAPAATKDDIRRAYFEAAKRYHPDRLASLGLEAMRADVEKIFRRVGEAYATLSDDARRTQYIASLTGEGDTEGRAKATRIIEAELAFRRGEILLRKNDFIGALKEFEAAAAGNPDEGEHLAYVAWTRVCAGQISHADAKPLLLQAIRLSPRCARAHYFLGLIYKEEGDVERAHAAFRRSHELDSRQLDAEREIRLIHMRREKEKKPSGIFDRFRKPTK